MQTNTQKGKKGELMAEKYLLEKNYTIIQKNYRTGRFEIDIIAKLNEVLVFVEVKYRKTLKFGFPEQAVSKTKIKQLKLAAEIYILDNEWHKNIRFDIIAIVDYQNVNLEILHFEDAF